MRVAPTLPAPLAALAVVALLPAAASAAGKPQGLIEEAVHPSHVGTIATGGRQDDLWFTKVGPTAAVGWLSRGGKVHEFPLPAGASPRDLVVGSEGAGWFTYSSGGALGTAAGGVGRVTRAGDVSLFPESPNPSGPPSELVVGPTGDLWFNHSGALVAGGDGIGRITKTGEIAEYSAGLPAGAKVTKLEVGGDGNVWFADNSGQPAIGRITAAGEITEFTGFSPQRSPSLAGPSSAGGSLYFAANGGPEIAVERITPSGEVTSFHAGLAADAIGIGPLLGGVSTGDAWFRIERRSGLGTTASPDGPLAIGHISAAGKIAEYSRCLRPMPAADGIRELIKGPDGNVWFANSPTGSPRHFRRLAMASIGQITPSGRITEFRLGLHPSSEPEDLTAAAGAIWFVDRHNGRIGAIAPPTGPANTFQALRLLHGKSIRPAIELEVPGPGKLQLREIGKRPGLTSSTARARTCGPTTIAVPMRPPLVQTLQRRGVVFIDSLITFTPSGGSPLSDKVEIEVGVAGE